MHLLINKYASRHLDGIYMFYFVLLGLEPRISPPITFQPALLPCHSLA
jgi:hypothetical protein